MGNERIREAINVCGRSTHDKNYCLSFGKKEEKKES
jgi:hypothetical protein